MLLRMPHVSPYKSFPLEFAGAAKVDEQTDSQTGCFQVIEKLGFFAPSELVKGLEFNNDLLIADNICYVLLVELPTFV